MVSLSSIQTKGLKRQFAEEEWKNQMESSGVPLEQVIVHDKNYNDDENLKPKKIKLKKPQKLKPVEIINDPNVLGFASSSSSEEESDEESEITNNSNVDIKDSIETDVKSEPEQELKSLPDPEAHNKNEIANDSPVVEKTVYVPVSRTPEVIESRSKLPIISEEHTIIDKIRHNDVVILAGETGKSV